MVSVSYKPGHVTPAEEYLSYGVLLWRDLVPPSGVVPMSSAVEVVAPWERASAGEHGSADLECRLTLTKSAIEANALTCEGVQVRSFNEAHSTAIADYISAERIETYTNQVHNWIWILDTRY